MKRFQLALIIFIFVSFLTIFCVDISNGESLTLITHGYSDETSGWIDWMAYEIESNLINTYSQYPSIYTLTIDINEDENFCHELSFTGGVLPNESNSADIIILLNWHSISHLIIGGWTSTDNISFYVANILMYDNNLIPGFDGPCINLPIHLIGHSRGGSLVCGLSYYLGNQGIWVDHLTMFDPVSVMGAPWDFPIEVYTNVTFSDNYYRLYYACDSAICFPLGCSDEYVNEFSPVFDIGGTYINGSYNRRLILNENSCADLLNGSHGYHLEHSDTHLWYHGTIDTGLDAFDGEKYITSYMRDNWWNAYEGYGATTGFYFSRIRNGDRITSREPVPGEDAVKDGYHISLGGQGSREPLSLNNAIWPNILDLIIERQTDGEMLKDYYQNIVIGEMLNIKCTIIDHDSPATVYYYLDQDKNPFNLNSTLICNNTHSSISNPTIATINFDTSALNEGDTYYIYAKIVDTSISPNRVRYFYAYPKLTFSNSHASQFKIEAFSGSNGSISPEPDIYVNSGQSALFMASPNSGYEVNAWYVNDGTSPVQYGGNTYELTNVQEDSWVLVTFKEIQQTSDGITVTSPINGSEYARENSMYIGWMPEGSVSGYVKIELFKNSSFESVITDFHPVRQSYGWVIPYNLTLDSGYQIKVTSLSSAAFGFSGTFSVVEPQNTGGIIEVYTAQDLQNIASGSNPVDGHYLIMNDINANALDFVPITTFEGILDGQGYTISNLWVQWDSQENVGMFRSVKPQAIIKNLNITGGEIEGKRNVGAITARLEGNIINCHIATNVTNESSNAQGLVGGLVGTNWYGTIKNSSYFDMETKSNGDYAGLIAGWNYGTIENCFSYNANARAKENNAGGIAGYNFGSGIIRSCYIETEKSIWGNDAYAGGITGINEGIIENCYSKGTVNGDSSGNNGGIAGRNEGAVTKCYAIGPVDLVGGGLVGSHLDGQLQDSFWDIQTSQHNASEPVGWGSAPVVNCFGKSTSEMKQKMTFTTLHSANWDFQDVWYINEGVDYPKLRAAGPTLVAPSNVNASDNLGNRIEISWNSVSNIARYKVYRSDSVDGIPNPISPWISTNSYTDNDVIPEAQYFYFVKAAYNSQGAGESDFSQYDSGQAVFQLNCPENISASDNYHEFILVTWDSVDQAQFYKVYRSDSPEGEIPLTPWMESTEFIDTEASLETIYYYWVKASVDDLGFGESDLCGPVLGSRFKINSDVNGDHIINLYDWALLSSHWLNNCEDPSWCDGTDLNRNGIVNLADLNLFFLDWLIDERIDVNELPECNNYTFYNKFGSGPGAGNGQFNVPTGIAIDSQGYIYVAEKENDRIQKFSADGTYVLQWDGASGSAGVFENPTGLAFNSNGLLYVSENESDRVQVFNGISYVSNFGSTGSGDGQLRAPRGITFDSTKRIHIVDSGNSRIQVFDLNHNYLGWYGGCDDPNHAGSGHWHSLGSTHNPAGGNGEGEFSVPHDIAYTVDGYIFVVDYNNHRIQKLTENGGFIMEWGSGPGTGNYEFKYPHAIAADRNGNVYISDPGNHRVVKYSSEGLYLCEFGTGPGTADGEFNAPTGITVDINGNVYVVDSQNHRVQIFEPSCDSGNMVYIAGGTFEMGDYFQEESTDEDDIHTVFLSSFYMGKHEVTNQDYCDFLNSAYPSDLKIDNGKVYHISDSGNLYPYYDFQDSYSQIGFSDAFYVKTKNERQMNNDPVVMVSWYGAAAYTNWLSQQFGRQQCFDIMSWECDFTKNGYRLPTEAEWEYAARGGHAQRRFPWGDQISHDNANYCSYTEDYDISTTSGYHPLWGDDLPCTSPVGSFSANDFGLYDMAGNVIEWCYDWYGSTYYSECQPYIENPRGPINPTTCRVTRGGAWRTSARFCKVADRLSDYHGPCPYLCMYNTGFRVVMNGN